MTLCNDDLVLVASLPRRITDKALQITGVEAGMQKHLINQYSWTNPGEVGELRQLVELATINGRNYLEELCRQSRLTGKIGGVKSVC